MSRDDLRLDEELKGSLTDTLEITMVNDSKKTVITNVTAVHLNRTVVVGSEETLYVTILEGRNETLDVDDEKFIVILSEYDYEALEADLLKQRSDLNNF